MPLKTSSFNREIIKQDFRNVGWVGIVYFLGLFFTGPLQLWMELSREETYRVENAGMFGSSFGFDLQIVFLFIMPVLLAVFLFRYLHVKEASDFTHSFPMKRTNIFNHHIVSALVLLLTPILLTYILTLFTSFVVDVSDYFTLSDAGYWLWLMSFITLFIFISSVFVGTLTGLSAVQGILTYIFLLFPAGIYGLVAYHLSTYINGYSGDIVLNRTIEYYSPLVDVVKRQRNNMGEQLGLPVEPIALIIYGLLAVLLYAGALVLYKKRPLESASKAIAVTSLHPVFKYGVTFCFAMLGGMYFGVTQYSYGWMIAGYVVGGTIGFFAATMLLEKTWRVFSLMHLKGWFGYGVAAGVLIAVLPLFWQNYESYIPSQSEIEQVYLGSGYYQYEAGMTGEEEVPFIHSREAVESVRELHKDLIAKSHPMESGNDYFFFAYQMENGEEVFRKYQVDRDKIMEKLAEVYDTEEYKKLRYEALNINSEQIQKVSMIPRLSPGADQDILDSEKIASFMKALKADIRALSYKEIIEPKGLATNLSFLMESFKENDQEDTSPTKGLTEVSPNGEFYPSYQRTMEWLRKEGYYEEVIVQAKDIDRVEIYQWPEKSYIHSTAHYVYDQMKADGLEPFVVEDEDKIEKALNGKAHKEEGAYLAAVIFDENDPHRVEVLSFEDGEAPDFIREHFE